MILWSASVIIVAVLFFWIGVWWRGIHIYGKHEFVPRKRHGDGRDSYLEAEEYPEDGFNGGSSWLPRRLASAPEGWSEDAADDDPAPDGDLAMEADTAPMEPPPATAKPRRWWSDDDDTAVLPRIQDIRPPSRPTPIRRPPWIG